MFHSNSVNMPEPVCGILDTAEFGWSTFLIILITIVTDCTQIFLIMQRLMDVILDAVQVIKIIVLWRARNLNLLQEAASVLQDRPRLPRF